MLVLITYDVNTETAAGKARLRKVAKQCTNYGRRVQNSVFECILDNAQCITLKAILADLIDEKVDSLRFYYLGNKYQTKVEHLGVDRGVAADQTLIFWDMCELRVNIKMQGDSHRKGIQIYLICVLKRYQVSLFAYD